MNSEIFNQPQRMLGAYLILGFLFFAGHLITLFVYGHWSSTVFLVLLYGFMILAAAVPILNLYKGISDRSLYYCILGFVFHGLLVTLVCALILAQLQLSEEYKDVESARSMIKGIYISMDKIRSMSFVFLGIGLFFKGHLLHNNNRFLGWLGKLSGVIMSGGMLLIMFNILNQELMKSITYFVLISVFIYMLVLGTFMLISKKFRIQNTYEKVD